MIGSPVQRAALLTSGVMEEAACRGIAVLQAFTS
jgi:hypothetical protein